MELLLSVASYQGVPPARPQRLRLGAGSATLGRNPGNDLVLSDPDRLVSGVHADIEVRPDSVWLTDKSTNGTFLNHAPERLAPHQPVQIRDGDILSVGPYEIAVSLNDAPAADDPGAAGLAAPGPAPDIMALLGGHSGQPAADLQPVRDPFADAQPLNSVLTGPAAAAAPAEASARPTPLEHVFFRAPETQPIPEDYDLLGDLAASPAASGWDALANPAPNPPGDSAGARAAPEPTPAPFAFQDDPFAAPPAPEAAPPVESGPPEPADRLDLAPPPLRPTPGLGAPVPPVPQPAPAATELSAQAGLTALLGGLGTGDPDRVGDPQALLRQAGVLLRALTAGLVSTMMVRARFKSELRLGMTVIRPTENNPFKFSVSPDEALERLLLRPNPGFLPPLEAAREAFEDIQAHEMAMVAGLRAALRALLARFEPAALEARLETASGLDKLLPMARKSRYWEQFTETYGQVAADAEEDFMQLFGETFTRAYEDQIRHLAEARKRVASG